ncbi:MAG: hypothetical protein ACQESG_03640 [Nanobdellota archaeon]
MSQKEFNEFLGNYLSSKRRPKKRIKNVKNIFQKEEKVEIPELERGGIQVIKKDETLFQRMFRNKKPQYEGDIPKEEVEKELASAEFDSEEEEIKEEIEASPTLKERVSHFFSRFKRPQTEDEEVYTEDKVYDDEGYLITELEELEEKEEELINQEKMLKSRRKGLIKSIIRLFKEQPEREEPEISPDTTELEEELKEVARFTVDVMKSLPKRKIQDLKHREEFKRFKEILKKRDLIRE